MLKNRNLKLLFYSSGIFFCYFYFGVFQERITRGKYELSSDKTQSERFTYILTLISIMVFTNYLFAKIMLYVWPQPMDKTNNWYYFSNAVTYLLAMVASNMALQWVPYPTQVVAKAAKPIPIIMLTFLLGTKSYSIKKYCFVLIIVLGVILFMLKDDVKTIDSTNINLGRLLLLLSLIMDGLVAVVQDKMRTESSPTGQYLMLNINFWSTIILAIGTFVTGEIFGFISFCGRHPQVYLQIISVGVANALGQLFILLVVSEFGPLACSIVTTTRKFFTVLGSVILFGNVLSTRQWIGTILVFTGLFLDAKFGKSSSKTKVNGKKLTEN